MAKDLTKIHQVTKGMHSDFSPSMQPENTVRFALNAVSETDSGEFDALSNEMSTTTGFSFNYIPLGKVYIEKDKSIIFSVKEDETDSEIGIKTGDNYQALVNTDLNFKLKHQIRARFRLRKGCERSIYWIDGYNRPKQFNIDRPEKYKTNDIWDSDKFNLFRRFSSIPKFASIEINENGVLPSGSYNAAIQYLDEDFNPTEFILTSDVIIIYHKKYSDNFHEIRGTTNKETSYQVFGITGKSIDFEFSNLDSNYPYYRVAIIEANSGTGVVTKVTASDPISTANTKYTYTGANNPTDLTEEEVASYGFIINAANYIEQVENRLILANTKGPQIDYCKLQQYASQIYAEGTFKTIVLDDILDSNCPKRGTVYFDNSVGYQPGEIYSFGIVYVFKDGTQSPVYHIPGRASNDVWSKGYGDFPMNNSNNELTNTEYQARINCLEDYWGKDYNSNILTGEKVRHHRFPSRKEVNAELGAETMKLINKDFVSAAYLIQNLYVNVVNSGVVGYDVTYRVNYLINGESSSVTRSINMPASSNKTETILSTGQTITGVTLDIQHLDGTWTNDIYGDLPGGADVPFGRGPVTGPNNLNWTLTSEEIIQPGMKRLMKSDIMGIIFENIVRPKEWDGTNHEVTGYFIVRNERTEDQKTILDTVALRAMFDQGKYIAFSNSIGSGLVQSKRAFAFISPEHIFRGRQYNVDEIELLEERVILGAVAESDIHADEVTQDVMAGTSYDPDVAKNRVHDNDGFDLHIASRLYATEYEAISSYTISDVDEILYLDALSYKIKDLDGTKTLYNAASDNRIGVITTLGDHTFNLSGAVRYGVLKRNLADPYGDFRSLPYYKESKNIQEFGEDSTVYTSKLYKGDVFTGNMNYNATIYYNTVLADREEKRGVWKTILGVVVTVVGAVVAVFGNIVLPAGAAVLGAAIIKIGVSMISSGITLSKLVKAYVEAYNDGLREAIADTIVTSIFSNPPDDEIQFYNYILKDLYFESQINISQRIGSSGGVPDFLNSLNDDISSSDILQHQLEKLTSLDEDNNDGRLFQGFTGAEIYELNPDYYRGNKQKIYFHLPVEYDCCSPCPECNAYRVQYSEQSFQEELTDNYRTFLPNNYKDIEGETGKITGLFKIKDQLYIHTEEALWLLPKQYQERITGEVVSYLGTGAFFSIPPKKILDAFGNSGGCTHSDATLKTAYGVFFVSEKERKIYHFNGQNIIPISDIGRKTWFEKHIPFKEFKDSFILNGVEHEDSNTPLLSNPSHPLGKGFISAYDEKLKRLIFTKIDYEYVDNLGAEPHNPKYEYYEGNVYRFNDYLNTILTRKNTGWTFVDTVFHSDLLKLKFRKLVNGLITTEYEDGTLVSTLSAFIGNNKSWTVSYSLKKVRQGWLSMHSYLPNFYISDGEYFHSWNRHLNYFYKHFNKGSFLNFYGTDYPFILEFAIPAKDFNAEVWSDFQFYTEAKVYDSVRDEWKEDRFTTFNKAIIYNTRQCTGELTLQTKNNDGTDYMVNQIKAPAAGIVLIDKNEKFWSVNSIRDVVTDYTQAMFNTDINSLQSQYYIDKIINSNVIDFNKDWTQLESFRDKYLIIRLKFSNFENVKLLFNSLRENGKISYR